MNESDVDYEITWLITCGYFTKANVCPRLYTPTDSMKISDHKKSLKVNSKNNVLISMLEFSNNHVVLGLVCHLISVANVTYLLSLQATWNIFISTALPQSHILHQLL